MVSSSRNNTICRVDSHFIQEKFQRIFFYRLVIYKTYRFPYPAIFYTGGNFFHQTFALITINIQLRVSRYFYHVC